jgi:dihydroorotate dehydrogenase
MYSLLKPLLFLLSPENAHAAAMRVLDTAAAFPPARRLLRAWFAQTDAALETKALGLEFPNPVGLAAGFDKDGKHIRSLACLGFGFIEVGTVTPRPQAGNPKPRLFRLPADRALINRMGFNNDGLEALTQRLQQIRQEGVPNGLIIGGNIGKNKDTPNETAAEDYCRCFEALFPWVDYFVVNVSSPNTPNLRALQEKEPLRQLLETLQVRNTKHEKPKPILLKIAPDLTDDQLDEVAEIVRSTQIGGIIATNTTISRKNLKTQSAEIKLIGSGGLSGAPLFSRSTDVIRRLREKIGTDLVIIAVGGIDSPQAAQEKLDAGANLVQVYTGLIYEGPGLVSQILNHLRKL